MSPAGLRRIWGRHDLETMNKPLRILEATISQEGWVLSESGRPVLETAKADEADMTRLAALAQ